MTEQKTEEDKPIRLLGTLGWILLGVSLLLFVAVAVSLPTILGLLNFDMNTKFGLATRIIIQVTLGTWGSSAVMSAMPYALKLYTKMRDPNMSNYGDNRKDVIRIRDLSAWTCGLLTALGVYAIQWFGGGI